MTREELFRAIKARYSEADLDDEVHQAKSQEASDINNQGIDVQLEYLEEVGGLGFLEEYFLSSQALPENLNQC